MATSHGSDLRFVPEAERCLLGSIFLEPRLVDRAARDLVPEDFTLPEARQVFEVMLAMWREGLAPEPVGVAERCGPKLASFLGDCEAAVITATSAADYAEEVRSASRRRALFAAAHDIATAAVSSGEDAVRRLVHGMQAVSIGRRRGARDLRDILADVLPKLLSDERPAPCPRFGITGLDDRVFLTEGMLVHVAARTSHGKTSLAVQAALHAARDGIGALLFSVEVPGEDVLLRTLAVQSGVGYDALKAAASRRGALSLGSREAVLDAELPAGIRVVDESRMTIDDVAAVARSEWNRQPYGLVVIDYLTLLQTVAEERREAEIARLSRDVKVLAREMNLPVVCCAQLNRESAKAKDKSPLLHQLRDSGAIEQDADAVVLLWQPYLDSHKAADRGKALLRIGKNRHGPVADVWATYVPAEMRFADAE